MLKQTLYGNTIDRINIGSCSRGRDRVNVTRPSMDWKPLPTMGANNLVREKVKSTLSTLKDNIDMSEQLIWKVLH